MTYTGYIYEQLQTMAETDQAIARLLSVTDILVDGPYIEAQRDLDLKFRGSANQRILILNKKLDKLIDLN